MPDTLDYISKHPTVSIGLAVLGLVVIYIVFWLIPRVNHYKNKFNSDSKADERVKAVEETRKTIAQIAGGIILLGTFAYTIQKDSATLFETRTQEKIAYARQAGDTYLASARAFTLKSPTIDSASIFEMGEIASHQRSLFAPVMATLQAYLLESSQIHGCSHDQSKAVNPATQAVLQVLAQRKNRPVDLLPDEEPANTAKSQILDIPIKINGINLTGVSFTGVANNLSGVEMKGVWLYASDFNQVDLSNANFEGACGSDRDAYGPKWKQETASAAGTSQQPAWAQWERFLYAANFTAAMLECARFNGARLNGALYVGAYLLKANFQDADLTRADFHNSNLENVDFTGATLTSVNFLGASNVDKALLKYACAEEPPSFDSSVKMVLPKCGAQPKVTAEQLASTGALRERCLFESRERAGWANP